jgi:hypothetical protein
VGLSLILKILKPCGFNFDTFFFFQIQEFLGLGLKTRSSFMSTLHIPHTINCIDIQSLQLLIKTGVYMSIQLIKPNACL